MITEEDHPTKPKLAFAEEAAIERRTSPESPSEILIVDDEPTLRMGFRIALTSEGHQVEEAPDGETAVAQIRSRPNPYHVVVLDLRMPGMDGLEVADFLAKEQIVQPTLILSAHLTAELALRAMQSGVADFLVKPVRPSELRSAVSRIVAEEKALSDGRPLVDEDASLRFLTRRRDFTAAKELAGESSSPVWRMLLPQLASTSPESPVLHEDIDVLSELTSQS